MFSQGTVNVPCTLLHFMDDELVDVAVGRIVQPGIRVFHGNPMPDNVYKVQLIRVLDGYGEMLPPYRPPGAEDEDVMDPHGCLNWSMLCPKSQIRLGWGTTPPHRQSCRRQAMPRPLQRRRLIQATTPRTSMWHKIGATPTPTHYLPMSMTSTSNSMGATWTTFSHLLLKNQTLVQKTPPTHLVARR